MTPHPTRGKSAWRRLHMPVGSIAVVAVIAAATAIVAISLRPDSQSTPHYLEPGRTYTLVAGDTLAGVAQKLSVPASEQSKWIQDLLALNRITAISLQVGQVLQVPPIPSAPTATPWVASRLVCRFQEGPTLPAVV